MKEDYSRQLPPEWLEISKVFAALGSEQRQRIVLLFDRDEWLNLSQIVEASTLSRTPVVHHLRALYDAGILRRRKAGKEVFYALDTAILEQSLREVLDYIRMNYQ